MTTPNGGEEMKKYISYIAGGDGNWCNHSEN